MTYSPTSQGLKQALLAGHDEIAVDFRVPDNNEDGYRDIKALASQTTCRAGSNSQPEEFHIEAPLGSEKPLGLQQAYTRLGIVGLISGNDIPFILVTATGSFPLKKGFTVTQTGRGLGATLVVDMR